MSFFVTRPPVPVPGRRTRRSRARRRYARRPARRRSSRCRQPRAPPPAEPPVRRELRPEQAQGALARSRSRRAREPGQQEQREERPRRPRMPARQSRPAVAAAPARERQAPARLGAPTSAPGAAMRARTVPTSTVSPSWTRISATTPSAGLGTSVSTLSVEISSSGSSRPIGSPTWRSHFVTVPSETETPIWGITTSVCVPVDTVPPVASRRRALSAHSRRRRPAG